jgi:hypothetical protein
MPIWFKEFNVKNKFISIFLIFSVFFMSYNIFFLIRGNPKLDELIQIRSEKIHDFHERTFMRKFRKTSSIGFRTDDGTYLMYRSAYPNYSNVTYSLQNENDFIFLFTSPDDPDTLYQISAKNHSIVSYEEICKYKIDTARFNIIINFFFFIGGWAYLSKVMKKGQKEITIEEPISKI